MRYEIRLDKSWRRIVPVIKGAHRHAAPDRRGRSRPAAGCRSNLPPDIAQCPVDRRDRQAAVFRGCPGRDERPGSAETRGRGNIWPKGQVSSRRRTWDDQQALIVCRFMEAKIFAQLFRVLLRGIAHVLGSLGIFCFYWSCLGAHLAAQSVLCLGTATVIVLACAEKNQAR